MVDVGGGRVSIEVVGDATGLGEDVRAKVEAAVADVSIKVPLEVDAAALRARVDAAARLAEAGQEIQLRVTAQTDELRARLTEAAIEASAGEAAHVGVELESGAAERIRAHLEAVAAEAGAGVNAHIGVEVDRSTVGTVASAAEGLAEEEAAGAAEEEAGGASSAAAANDGLGVSALAAAAALAILTGGLGAATGAAGGLIGMVAPLGGLLAAIPAGISVMGAGVGTLVAGLHGVIGAVQQLGKEQTAQGGGGGGSAQAYADAQATAADRVRQAHESIAQAEQHLRDVEISYGEQRRRAAESLANTEYQVAQQRVQDSRAVIAAEYSLQQAERSSTDAERALTAARKEAQRQLEDSANAAKDAAFAQQDAQLALESARQNAAQTAANPNATALQRQQAALAVQEAQQRLAEATEQATRAQQDNTETQAKGVDGADAVISATERLADAQHAVQMAVQSLNDAQNKQARDAVTGAQQMANAQQQLRDTYRTTSEQVSNAELSLRDAERGLAAALRAQHQAAQRVGGAASAAHAAMAKLSPEAQAFARQIRAILDGPLKTLEQRAQNALVPGLSRGLTILAGPNGLWPQLNRLVGFTGTAIGTVAERMADMMASPATRSFLERLGPATHRILVSVGDGLAHWGAVFRDFAGAALPLVERLSRGFDTAARHLDAFFSSRRGQADLTRFFDQVYRTTHAWGQILKELGGTFFGLIRAMVPAGNTLNDTFLGVVTHWNAIVNSSAGQERLRRFFNEAVPVVEALGRAIAAISRALANSAGDQGWANFLNFIAKLAPLAGGEIGTIARGFGLLTSALGPLSPILGPVSLGLLNLWAAIKVGKTVNDAVERVSKAIKTLGAVLTALDTGIADKKAPAIARAMAKVSRALRLNVATDKIAQALDPMVSAITGKLGQLRQKVASIASSIGSRIATVFKGGDAGGVGLAARTAEVEGLTAAEGELAGAEVAAGEASTLALGPIGLIAAGVVALGIAVYEAYKHFRPFREAVDAVGRFLKTVFLGALHGVADAFDWVRHHLSLLATVLLPLLGPIGLVVDAFLHWRQILGVLRDVFHDVITFVEGVPGDVVNAFGDFGGLIARFFRAALRMGEAAIKEYLSIWLDLYVRWPMRLFEALGHFGSELYSHARAWFGRFGDAVVNVLTSSLHWVEGLPGRILSGLAHLGSDLYNLARAAWKRFSDGVYELAVKTVQWVEGLPSRIFHALGNVDTMLYDAGKRIVEGLWNGIKHAGSKVGSVMGGLVGGIKDHLPFSPARTGPLRDFPPERGGANIARMIAQGLTAGASEVDRAASTLAGKVNGQLGRLKMDPRLTADVHATAQVLARGVGAVADAAVAAGQRFEFGPGSILVTNPAPEPASTSLANRMRRLSVMHEPLPRATPAPGAA